jgi:oligopeptide transport system substrate-binding protein
MLVFLVACSQPTSTPGPTPAPTATASPVPSAAPSPTPAATSTAIPTSTTTSTPSQVPAATVTPLPAPAPEGYYAHQTAGFNLIYPQGWNVDQEDSNSVLFRDSASGLAFSVARDTTPGNSTLKDDVASFIKGVSANFVFKQKATGQAALADGVMAETADLLGPDKQGRRWTVRLALAQAGGRRYMIVIFALSQTFAGHAQTLAQVLGSLQLTHDVYGLPRHQTLVLLGGDPDAAALDPAQTQGGAAGYVGLLFSGLVRLSPQLQIQPDLAESWAISPGGDTYTFTLRANLTFQSGAPLTAESVRYSWERAADPKTHSPTAGTYLGDIVGLKDRLAGKADHIRGLEVVDARTLVVHLDAAKAYFLAKLTYPTAFVVDSKNVASSPDRWMFHPNASGPFGLKDYRSGEVIIFERNLSYHAVAQIPFVVFRMKPGGAPLSLYESGDLDVTGVGSSEVVRVRSVSDPLHAQWSSTTSMCTSMLLFDVSRPPLDDLAVRQALALALDRDTLIHRLAENVAVRADTILPPGMPGYATDLPRVTFDAQAARAALARSPYAGQMPDLILNEGGQGGQPSNLLTAVADMWRQNLGLKVQIKQLDPINYTRAAREQHGNIVSYGWCADYPDPENFLDILFHTGSDFNVSGYSSAQVDNWLEAARTEADPARRLALYHQVESTLLGDVALIPLDGYLIDVLVKPYVKGYVQPPMDAQVIPLLSLDYGASN